MCQEQLESLEDNQSYIDDLKMQFGMQQEFIDSCKDAFGLDYRWWVLPTWPELRTNYFEQVWPKKEIKKMYKTEQFEKNTDDSDPDKRLFLAEQRRSHFEKKLVWCAFVVCLLSWVFYF